MSWSSKKQSALAISSTEAEYRAITTTVEEAEGILLSIVDGIGNKNSFTNKGKNI